MLKRREAHLVSSCPLPRVSILSPALEAVPHVSFAAAAERKRLISRFNVCMCLHVVNITLTPHNVNGILFER